MTDETSEIFEIITWPHPVLKKPARKVSISKLPHMPSIVEKMIRTMISMKGIGLAAPQVGISERFFIAILDEEKGPEVVINPIILQQSKEKCVDEEGCLSFPDQYAQVPRATWITVSWTDLEGRNIENKLENFAARVFLHEFDHLNGVLLVNNAVDGLYTYEEDNSKLPKK